MTDIKEKPILFSSKMVKAILEGRKTQTRRVIKPQFSCQCEKPDIRGQLIDWVGWKYEGQLGYFCYKCGSGLHAYDEWSSHGIVCPYGQHGDRLWVRETWASISCVDGDSPKDIPKGYPIWYCDTPGDEPTNCGDDKGKTRPSIFMPRWASRITLEITGIRVQKVQEITNQDADAEGLYDSNDSIQSRVRYAALWDSINAKRGYSWESNPWVWVIEFKKC